MKIKCPECGNEDEYPVKNKWAVKCSGCGEIILIEKEIKNIENN